MSMAPVVVSSIPDIYLFQHVKLSFENHKFADDRPTTVLVPQYNSAFMYECVQDMQRYSIKDETGVMATTGGSNPPTLV